MYIAANHAKKNPDDAIKTERFNGVSIHQNLLLLLLPLVSILNLSIFLT